VVRRGRSIANHRRGARLGQVARLAVGTLAVALAACGEEQRPEPAPPPPPAERGDFPEPERGQTLAELRSELAPGGPVLAPSVSVLEPGRSNRFGFGLFDRSRRQIADAAVALYLAPVGGGRVEGPYPARYESLAVKPQFQSQGTSADPDAATSVYVADLPIRKPGRYEVLGVVALDDRLVSATSSGPPMEVTSKSEVPEVGDPAPRISTPTVASAGGAVEEIDTRVPPAEELHRVDFADVVGRKPVLLLFATPALCASRVCGPVVDVALEVKAARDGDDVEFIHQEIYEDNDPGAGFRPQVREWGLPTEPWAFAIDRDGEVAARLEGAFSARELQRAVDAAVRG
jgi:hypothetical protein